MLNRPIANEARPRGDQANIDAQGGEDLVSLQELVAALRRNWRLMALSIAGGLVIGILYLLTATPIYQATSLVLLDPFAEFDQGDDRGGAFSRSTSGLDGAYVNSQVELIRSRSLLSPIAQQLALPEDPRYADSFESILEDDELEAEDKEDALIDSAMDMLEDSLSVERIEDTYVLAVSFESEFPDQAAMIANSFVQAYLDQEIDAKYDLARRSVSGMKERLDELRQQMSQSNASLTAFRREHNLVSTGDVLLLESQLMEVSNSLMTATADRIAAEARWQQVRSAPKDSVGLGLESINSPILSDLRLKYLTFKKEHEESLREFGEDHPQTERLAAELEGYERLIGSEVYRIAQGYQSDLRVSLTREEKLIEDVERLEKAVVNKKDHLIDLERLSGEAAVYRTQYEVILDRYQAALHQLSTLVSEARIISPASEPQSPIHPRKGLVLALSLLAGFALGGGLVAFRELRQGRRS